MKNIDKLRKTKPEPSWAQWLFLIAACFSGVGFIVSLVDKNPGYTALIGTLFAVNLLSYQHGSQKRINQELLEEIDTLKNELEDLRAQTDEE